MPAKFRPASSVFVLKNVLERQICGIIIWYSRIARLKIVDRQAGCIGPDFGISTKRAAPVSSSV